MDADGKPIVQQILPPPSSASSSTVPSQPIIHVQYHSNNSPFPTGVILDETNYSLWSQVMEMCIDARNKEGYLTGTVVKPPLGDPNYDTWVSDNHKVRSWLIDSRSKCL
ncbi:hypothetical protein ACLB2K_007106 [Fragaria x ananassa]